MTYEEFLSTRRCDLLKFVVVLCGERMRAEDVVPEVLIRAHLRWDRIAAADSPFAHVRTMVVNENLSWPRKWSRQGPIEDLEHLPRRSSPLLDKYTHTCFAGYEYVFDMPRGATPSSCTSTVSATTTWQIVMS